MGFRHISRVLGKYFLGIFPSELKSFVGLYDLLFTLQLKVYPHETTLHYLSQASGQ